MTQTLKQKIGQLFLVGFEGDKISANQWIARDIEDNCLGGVILFDRLLAKNKSSNNIISANQLRNLTEKLQKLAESTLLIAVDQEGGKVNRFKEGRGFITTPCAAIMGKEQDHSKTAASAEQTAEMLVSTGINFNLAPVVDLDIYKQNPIIGAYGRSFSPHPQEVTAHAATWIEEHQKKGVISCLKHFPGHGSSRHDSHLGFVDITTTWREDELYPYRQLIEQGRADSIMVGHLLNRSFDAHYPATLSQKTIQNIARKKLQFTGLLISDDMQMKAITDHYGLKDGCCLALAAGMDMLIVGNNIVHDPEIFVKLRDAVLTAVSRGQLTEQRIDNAWKRVQKLKEKIGKHRKRL